MITKKEFFKNKHITKLLNYFSISLIIIIGYLLIHIGTLISSMHKLHFLNVGQGDAILIRTANNNLILIDGGPSENIAKEIYKFIHPLERTIHTLILTHPDKDHLEGLIYILNHFHVENIFIAKANTDSSLYNEFKQLVISKNIATFVINDLNDFEVDEITFDILWPTSNINSYQIEEINNTSISIMINFGKSNILTTGDLEEEYEPYITEAMYKNSNYLKKLEVLKAGHHGSNTSTKKDLLDATNPKYALISAGKDNIYGHPHPDVVRRLEDSESNILRTYTNGNLTIELFKDRVKIITEDNKYSEELFSI